ncbi:polysaccharide biosynthesis protein [Ectothiorhodospira mobilis]|uniref:polysaccharide biosynthesis protein n=1 Tax=Ectothiorhodospira mobilis TaxID=195064 RepID=UPI001905DCE6|nr:nucleoside-diphosphate sugar epimerase/dehydratase [Ectothiorhodospira mobilis]MBK1691191.1 polysaccharide biosynthesis protein [Ectothiorhodospira mobilis]
MPMVMLHKLREFPLKRWAALVHDLLWVPTALFMGYWTHANFRLMAPPDYAGYADLLPLVVAVQGGALWGFGLYRGIWRFASLPDLVRILKAVAGGTLGIAALVFLLKLQGVPRTVMVLYPIFLTMGLTGPRLLYRWFKDHRLGLTRGDAQRALVIGAGRSGEMLVRDLLKDHRYLPVGLLDDAPGKWGRELHGVRILGPVAELERLLDTLGVDVVLLAMPSASASLVRQVTHLCRQRGKACGTLPSIYEIAGGHSRAGQLREIRIEDLLGREAVTLDDASLRRFLQGRRVLITGAGGSIGSELCRQVALHDPAHLVMVDHSEFNLYSVDQDIHPLLAPDRFTPLLADVRDKPRLRRIFQRFRPQIVLHAAAYKHVPLVEQNAVEGVSSNLLGTRNTADLAVEFAAEKFLLVSTDKAVNPTNVMGATKRAAEIYCQGLHAHPGTAFMVTRFGNVLGSAGSVVPLFRRQIEAGGPVTVTHPEITRFFMTIPEAVSLILQAAAMGEGGEVFVLDMGEPVRIDDLARQMIQLYGREPDRDIAVEYVGLRPGEKLYEELFHAEEDLVPTRHSKILRARTRGVDPDRLETQLTRVTAACRRQDEVEVRAALREIVPEFTSQDRPAGPVPLQQALQGTGA